MIARIFWTLLFLGACIGWLVASYRPQWVNGSEIAFGPEVMPLFFWLFVASALLFVGIQVVLVAGVRTFPTRIVRDGTGGDGSGQNGSGQNGSGLDSSGQGNDKEIRIRPVVEFFWTALPLLISVLFFGAVWQVLTK